MNLNGFIDRLKHVKNLSLLTKWTPIYKVKTDIQKFTISATNKGEQSLHLIFDSYMFCVIIKLENGDIIRRCKKYVNVE